MSNKIIKQAYKNKQKIVICIAAIILSIFLITTYGKGQEKAKIVHSSTLSIVSTQDEKTDRIDYMDENGIITYAADKHYATRIKIQEGNSILEQYFDEQGNPAKQSNGYYAILREYTDNKQKETVTYLDIDGTPIVNYAGYAIIKRTYNDNGLLEKEFYFDIQSNPTKTYSVGSGCERQYDDEGRAVTLKYLNANGEVAKTGQGFAIIHIKYYNDNALSNTVKSEFYCDEDDKPVKLAKGQYGVHKECDEFGRTRSITYLDINGDPMICADGYATVKRTFYDDDSICTELYYDENDKPIALSEKQYGVRYQEDKKIYLDSQGNELFNLKRFLFNNRFFVLLSGIILAFVFSMCNKTTSVLLMLLYLSFVIYMTMLYRNNYGTNADFRLFWSYRKFFQSEEIRWEIIENIILFIPLGALLLNICRQRKVLLIIIAVSILIETFQYCTGRGLCELDDVISNSLGGWLGYCLGKLTPVIKKRINSWKHIHNA